MIRTAVATALLAVVATGQSVQPLGPMYAPVENPTTPAKVMLGKILFWDEQLSSDDTIACGTCHLPEFGGSDGRLGGINPGPDLLFGTADDIHGSSGVVRQATSGAFRSTGRFGLARQVTGRVAPTNLGAGHHAALFWDTRASNTFTDPETGTVLIPFNGALESQSVAPILSPVEMAREGRTWQDVRTKLQTVAPLALASNVPGAMLAALQQNPSYPLLFAAAFGDPAINAGRIAFALAAYQRTLNPDQTPWDAFAAGNPAALTPSEQQGWSLFQNQAQCTNCHWAPLFSDDLVHNLGLRPNAEDVGVMAVSGFAFDLGAFKTPTLRNAGLRPRLFHNGQSVGLTDPAQLTDPASTLNVYLNGGGVDPSNLDPFIQPLISFGVTAADLALVQDFVATALTDPRCANRLPPFDRPDLRSETVAPPRVFGPSSSGASEPFLIDVHPAYPGNLEFRLGAAGGDGAGLALLTYGFHSFEPNLAFGPLPWHVDVHDYIPLLLQGPPGQPGHATLHLPIPNDPILTQSPIYWQLFVDDPLAPLAIAASRGWEFHIQY